MKKQLYTIAALLTMGIAANAQVGIGTTTPNASSALDITSTTSGLLIPRMTTSQRVAIATPAKGLQVFDTTTNSLWLHNGTIWFEYSKSDLRVVGTNNHLTQDAGIGNNGTNAGTGGFNIGIGAGTFAGANTTGQQIAIGYSALNKNTDGAQNTAVGTQALANNTLGSNNVAMGWSALGANTTGGANMAIGYNALGANTTGISNIAMGYSALGSNNEGSNNVAYGQSALNLSKGSQNTAIGYNSLGAVANANNNVGVGFYAGSNITTGANNISIGANSQIATPADSNQLNIGSAIFGTGLSGSAISPAGNIGIGTATPAEKLDVNGKTKTTTLQVTTGATAGYVLTSDATGNATWNANTASGDLRVVGLDNHLTQDAGVGSNGTSVGTGTGNIAIGATTLGNNTTGLNNVAVGTNALNLNTSGLRNTAVGKDALKTSTTAGYNTAVGTNALEAVTTGSNNTGMGYRAMYAASTGNDNTAIGYNALPGLTTGAGNTALGNLAGAALTSGSNNIAIGNGTALPSTAANQMNIGNALFATGMTGTLAAPAGNIGIGTATPTEKLEVNGKTKTTELQVTTGATAGHVLTSDATGNATWNAAPVSDLRTVGTAGFGNHVTQDAGVGGNGTSLGSSTNQNHIAIGLGSMASLTNSIRNIGIGGGTLATTTTGSQNTAIGYRSLFSNVSGNFNTVIGNVGAFAATGSNNTVLGSYAGTLLTSGSSNILIGGSTTITTVAGSVDAPIPTGSNQMNIGNLLFGTGMTGTTAAPAGNIGIGTSAPAGKLAVASSASSLTTPTLSVEAYASPNVLRMYGLNGTATAPVATGNTQTLGNISFQGHNGTAAVEAANITSTSVGAFTGTNNGADLRFSTTTSATTAPTERMRITDSGRLAIGTISVPTLFANTPQVEVATTSNVGVHIKSSHADLDGLLYLEKSGASTTNDQFAFFYANGAAIGSITSPTTASIAYNTTSDVRLKENVHPTAYSLKDVMNIQVSDYNYKSDKDVAQTGFIAQQLYTIFPNAVTKGGDDAKKSPWMVDYSKVTPLLTKAIQEQQAEIETLKKANSELESRMEKLEKAFEALNAKN